MGENPSHFKGAERPVEQVSWEDAQGLIKRLNALVPGGDRDAFLVPQSDFHRASEL